VINRESMESNDLGALADIIANQTGLAPLALAELARRQTVFQQNAAEHRNAPPPLRKWPQMQRKKPPGTRPLCDGL
jgi:hypothetical protein